MGLRKEMRESLHENKVGQHVFILDTLFSLSPSSLVVCLPLLQRRLPDNKERPCLSWSLQYFRVWISAWRRVGAQEFVE